MAEQRLQFVEETSLYNHIVLGRLWPSAWWEHLPHFLQTWLRNYIGGNWLYFIPNFLWCFYIYDWKRNIFVPRDAIPGRKAMLLQIYVSMKAIAMFGIYWVHRALHDIKPLYRYLHATHHMYNKQNVLSPFAGMALQPLDGVLQALPHAIAPFIVPIHFRSHIALMFLEAIWTANIHDCIHAKIWPIMGAGYHTIHHTTNRYNYGHYTIFMDWMLGTLRDPIDNSYEKKM